jgi:hypothetical protein
MERDYIMGAPFMDGFWSMSGWDSRNGCGGPDPVHDDETVMNGAPMIGPPALFMLTFSTPEEVIEYPTFFICVRCSIGVMLRDLYACASAKHIDFV